MVERTAVNRDVVGSSPTRGVFVHRQMSVNFFCIKYLLFFLAYGIINNVDALNAL